MILGRSGSGKTTFCLEEMIQKQQEDPLGPPVIYLVPEQMTFQSEMKLIRSKRLQGMIRLQIYSFSRLAWRVLQETGGITRHLLNRTGIHMLLRKIVEHEKQRLRLFSTAADTGGFIQQLEEMTEELRRYAVTPEMLRARREELLARGTVQAQEVILADKLHDLSLILDRLQKHLEGKYLDGEDMLRLLAERVPFSAELRGAEVYIDGFHSFTPQEMAVVRSLLATARRVTVTLTLDRVPEELPDPLALFYMTARTYRQLERAAEETGCLMEEPVCLAGGRRFASPELAHIERVFEVYPSVPFDGTAAEISDDGQGLDGEHVLAGQQDLSGEQNAHDGQVSGIVPDAVQLLPAVNRRAEVEGVAREILHLVRDQGYRFRDVAIMVRNSQDYHDLIETIFEDYGIPVFMDQKRSMLNHPLIELLRSALEVVHANWRYEAVFRCLKTELLFPAGCIAGEKRAALRDEVDRLENYVLAHGIQGGRWFQQASWRLRGQAAEAPEAAEQELEDKRIRQHQGSVQTHGEDGQEEAFNGLRRLLITPLRRLQTCLERASTVREKCAQIYLFLEEQEIPRKIERLRDEALAAGELERAREHEQVWGAVVELLEQMVEILGDEPLSLDLFRKLLETGLESMQFALVPPALDQVLVAQMERSRVSDVKCVFILGANEGVIPARPKEDGMLSEEEREWLQQRGVELAPGSRQQLLDEQFLIYMALTRPAERLVVSYPLADEEGGTLLPSVLVRRMKEWLPHLQERLLVSAPHEAPAENQLDFVAHPGPTLSYLTSRLQEWRRGYPVETLWWDVYNWAILHPEWSTRARRLLASLFYRNEARPLAREQSLALYGSRLRLSVSRMERFQSCPFMHFAAYGLRLKERPLFRLEAPDIGQLFHAALKQITERLRAEGMDWHELTRAQCESLAREAVDQLAPEIGREILLSSNRYHYMKRKLARTVGQAAIILSEHARASGFSPVGLEVGFGPGESLPPLRFTLPDGMTLELVGRIDRVDKAVGEQGLLLRIIDYKSGRQELRLDELYHGLAWQMLVYLDVVLTYAPDWLGSEAQPAGVLYFHVHQPLIRATRELSAEELEAELLKQFRMKGLLLADPSVIRLMDQTLETGTSRIIPAGIKKDGTFYSHSSVISREDFGHLRRFVRTEISRIGERLLSGENGIQPFRLREKTACTFCPYRPVCQFDPTLDGNAYRVLKGEKAEQILARIRAYEAQAGGGRDGERDDALAEAAGKPLDG
ncbi:MAG: helicase-exonuclease AddAB subunit AddB [Bacillus thermozeamaize]|uniref:ATP-dependent helicase/deoxyribonuclease subunit B n=1 Tax=Bacillus thermozeamaize TaxID=230954 RepID=A0A1Y3PVD8_9BACI|nr:MAG: helicase-exonuclease AddAB subunit AddB [Bacillus thermozeamaize]